MTDKERCWLEATWFAAGFLMPDPEFSDLVRKGWSDCELGEHFDVDASLVKVRRSVPRDLHKRQLP